MHYDKKYLFLVFLFLVSIFFVPSSVSAIQGSNMKCLKAEKYNTERPFKRIISGEGFPPNVTVYLYTITIGIDGQKVMTSGDTAVNTILRDKFGVQTTPQGGQFAFLKGSATMTADGQGHVGGVELNAVPLDKNLIHKDASYFGVYEVAPASPTTDPSAQGGAGALQNATFDMTKLTAPGTPKDCDVVRWDPEGVVFDANTLVPLDGTVVHILDGEKKELDAGKDKNKNIGVIDTQTTTNDGSYSFIVYAGEAGKTPTDSRNYYLVVTPPPTYRMITNVGEIIPGYDSINPLNQLPIYRNINRGEVIKETYGEVAHADIALISSSKRKECSLITQEPAITRLDNLYVYKGDTGCPFTKVKAIKGEVTIKETWADIDGSFFMTIGAGSGQDQVGDADQIDFSFDKTDLTHLNTNPLSPLTYIKQIIQQLFVHIGTVFAQENTNTKHVVIHTQPIPRTVQGYARDTEGTVIPRAVVNIYLSYNNVKTITTSADAAGYFTIDSTIIPRAPFYITFINPITSKVTRVETSQFTKENMSLNTKITGTIKPTTNPGNEKIQITKPSDIIPTSAQTTNSQSVINIAILIGTIFVLTSIAIGVFFVFKRRQTLPPQQY